LFSFPAFDQYEEGGDQQYSIIVAPSIPLNTDIPITFLPGAAPEAVSKGYSKNNARDVMRMA
jgi:hypothetical protein